MYVAPSAYTFVARASAKSMRRCGLFSRRHTMYKHAATTWLDLRPLVKRCSMARMYRRCAESTKCVLRWRRDARLAMRRRPFSMATSRDSRDRP